MGFSEFLLLQFLAHVLADYFLQTDALALDKNTKGFKSKFLVWHALIVFTLAWLLSFQLHFFIGAGVIAITHYLIDGFKVKLNTHSVLGPHAFFIDQTMHLLIIVGVAMLYDRFHGLDFYYELPISYNALLILSAYLLCLKPANIFIKEVFRSSKIAIAMTNKEATHDVSRATELPNAGKVIGILERLLALTFIMIGEYQAVGFLIAAKSILRYKDTDTLKTEYVLIGTMLSFGIAVGLGIYIGL